MVCRASCCSVVSAPSAIWMWSESRCWKALRVTGEEELVIFSISTLLSIPAQGPQRSYHLGAACSSLFSVQVAPPADGTEEIATVKLLITGQGVSIEEKKKVLIRKASSGTFIQTDKPTYKPGQTGKSCRWEQAWSLGSLLVTSYEKTTIAWDSWKTLAESFDITHVEIMFAVAVMCRLWWL